MTLFRSGSGHFPSCRHFEFAVHRTSVQAQFCCYFIRTVTYLSVRMQSKCFVAVSRMLLTCTVTIADWLTPAAKTCAPLKHSWMWQSFTLKYCQQLISVPDMPSASRNFVIICCSCWMSTSVALFSHIQWRHKWRHQKYKLSEAHATYYVVVIQRNLLNTPRIVAKRCIL